MTDLPYPFVSDDGRNLNAEAVQGNFDALAQGADEVARVFGVNKRSGSATVTVTWPGGSRQSGTVAGVTHNYGTVARVLGQVQDQTNIGAAAVAFQQGANSFNVFVETTSFVPLAGTTGQVTVFYWEQ